MTEQDKPESADPFALWRQWYDQQQAWGKGVADTTGTEGFAEMQGKMLETFLAFQKTIRDASRAQLGSLGLPTREDIARLGEIVLGLEEKIDQLAERIDRLEGVPKARPGRPPRGAARRPPPKGPARTRR